MIGLLISPAALLLAHFIGYYARANQRLVLLGAPGDEDAIRCKIVALIRADNFEKALATIQHVHKLSINFSFFKVTDQRYRGFKRIQVRPSLRNTGISARNSRKCHRGLVQGLSKAGSARFFLQYDSILIEDKSAANTYKCIQVKNPYRIEHETKPPKSVKMYVFAGPSPQLVVQKYTQLTGLPASIHYWSLGTGVNT